MNTTASTAQIQETLQGVYEKYKDVRDGEVATYIPELAKAKPDDFGISLATVDGQVFSVGDFQQEFTIQSICKPFAFLMALEEFGRDAVLQKVCVEPSGDAFNSIELEPRTMRPFNPMINAGAIAIVSMIKKSSRDAGVQHYVNKMQLAAGRTLGIDQAVLTSEAATGNRNRAIAYLMLNCGIIDAEVDHALHQYFTQCSLLVNSQDLAMMAATLANMGINPVTGNQAFELEYVKDVLAVMFTCGLYDYAGEWAYRVGLPAKSGVGGGIIAVSPGKFGIAVVSPPLDDAGNSVRAQRAITAISNALGGSPYVAAKAKE